MDDQLELHMQRFLEDESEETDQEDPDLNELLTLQSSSYAASTKLLDSQSTGPTNRVRESTQSRQQQKSDDTKSETQVPLSPLSEHHVHEIKVDSEGKTGFPPMTVMTDRFFRISHFLESQLSDSYTDVIIKLLWVLPIMVVIGDHVGWIWSFQSTILGIAVFYIKPDLLVAAHDKHANEEATTNYSTSAVGPAKQRMNAQLEQKKFKEETIEKVSHLLGLAGAPPPLWQTDQLSKDCGDQSLEHEKITIIAMEAVNDEVNSNQSQRMCDRNGETDQSSALSQLVNFVESFVQFLLTVDQALDYLRLSASIHLGLGPQSQCVERVELAAVTRKIRQDGRKQQTKDDCKPVTKKRPIEPQRGTNKSVLSLVSLRRNLARSMVHHSTMLDAFWKCLKEHQENADEREDEGYSHAREPLLETPQIVNLAWIKDARRVLAESLTETVEELIALIEESSSQQDSQLPEPSEVWLWLENADDQSRQLTQYLRGTLLLPYDTGMADAPSAAVFGPVENPNDPLLKSLMNFRTQLDSLGTALWSCQQYCKLLDGQDESIGSVHQGDHQSTGLDNVPKHELNLEEDPIISQQEWWMKVRHMSEICRAFEAEITETYFPQEVVAESEAENDESNDHAQATTSQETGDYVHGDGKSQTNNTEGITKKGKPTKTVVFSGKGQVQDRPKSSARKGTGKNGTGGDSMDIELPQRDTVSQLAMVSELQNRIKTLELAEEIEEDEESDSEEQKAARLARQPTAPLFLGASGSLLSELKQSIPSIGFLNSGNNGEEEIIGED